MYVDFTWGAGFLIMINYILYQIYNLQVWFLRVSDCEELVGITWRVSDCEELVGVNHLGSKCGVPQNFCQ